MLLTSHQIYVYCPQPLCRMTQEPLTAARD